MQEVFQKYKDGNFLITVEEDVEAYFSVFKGGNEIQKALRIKILTVDTDNRKAYVGSYYKEWEDKVSPNLINKFISNFLEDAEFRRGFHSDGGEWLGVVSFRDDSGVNRKCVESIERFKRIRDKKFKDYASLKTYGIDKFSKMKSTELQQLIPGEIVKAAVAELKDEKLTASALKWVMRGLSLNDAVRKVKTDMEIHKNAR